MSIIRVEGHEIDTKDIVKITDSDRRRFGFKIHLVGPRVIVIDEVEPYEITPMQGQRINAKYDRLKDEVTAKWGADKSEIETFNLK